MAYIKIRDLRKTAGITQEQLSKEIGINRATLSRYESGTIDPPVSQLKRIASVLGVTIDDLLDLSDNEREEIEDIEKYVITEAKKIPETLHEDILAERIWQIPYKIAQDALEAADEAVVEKFSQVSETQLKKDLLDCYKYLNRRGRIEAVERMHELVENYRFKREIQESSEDK